MTSPWYTPVTDPHAETATVRSITGRRFEVRRWSPFWSRDVKVGTARTVEEAQRLAERHGGMVRDTTNGQIPFLSKRYKKRTGMGQGGMGGRPAMQPQISDRAAMALEMEHGGQEVAYEDWMADW